MAERKVLIKYYPPDFNPAKLIKNKRPKDKQDNVRMMLPMSMRCNTCGNYLYIGTKFNMRKETCLDEQYLGIRIYRFYLKCTYCYSEITFKTDPKNHDYIVEHQASRNYEPWRDSKAAEEALKEMRLEDEEGNAMKFLENKTYDSKREMEIMDQIDEIKNLNKRKLIITPDDLLRQILLYEVDNEDEEQEISDKLKLKQAVEEMKVKRIQDEDSDVEQDKILGEFSENNIKKQRQQLLPNSQDQQEKTKKFMPIIKKVQIIAEKEINILEDKSNKLDKQIECSNSQQLLDKTSQSISNNNLQSQLQQQNVVKTNNKVIKQKALVEKNYSQNLCGYSSDEDDNKEFDTQKKLK